MKSETSTPPVAPSPAPKLFITAAGKNVLFTFILVSSLFLLWGFCNGMIDVMDKHFQEELNLSLSQSAWVQFAHYLGYFLMALPAGWLAIKLGYKGGIITGLLMVAVGGLWFIPATQIASFWAFLVGVCVIAAGLTFLETIANPYTTVLGHQQFAATRINLAQSCNGIGWIFGPIVGGMFFYSKDASGASTGSQTLWIPYAIIALVVLVLSVVFWFADVPDLKVEDDYHLDDATPGTSRSIWTHPHFIMAVVAQFVYVAAQAGIFSFFINYMTSEVPAIAPSVKSGWLSEMVETKTTVTKGDITNLAGFAAKLKAKADPVSAFLAGKLSNATEAELAKFDAGSGSPRALLAQLVKDLNGVVKQNLKKTKPEDVFPTASRFGAVKLSDEARQMLEKLGKKEPVSVAHLNRLLLAEAYPGLIAFNQNVLTISDKGASNLASLGFIFFLLGRFSGAGLLKVYRAHRVLGLYAAVNVALCLLIFAKLGWLSVACVFLSYFFMSIMFPTIFALGIFGLGVRAKEASAYIVMAIMGGAVLPKLMGWVGDYYDMSRGFIVPLVCFGFVAAYGFFWPKLSGFADMGAVSVNRGH